MLPILPSRIHGILDYIAGVCLILYPLVTGHYNNYTYAPWVMVIAGILIIIYSILTRYESGYVGLISFQTHLWFDGIIGVFLVSSPWLLNFDQLDYRPHLTAGIVMAGLALLTRTRAREAHGPKLSPRSPAPPPEKIGA